MLSYFYCADEAVIDISASKLGSVFAVQSTSGKLQLRSRSAEGVTSWDADLHGHVHPTAYGSILAMAGSSLAVAHGPRVTVFDASSGNRQHSYEAPEGYSYHSVTWNTGGTHTWSLALPATSGSSADAIKTARVTAGVAGESLVSGVSFTSPVQADSTVLVGGSRAVLVGLEAGAGANIYAVCIASKGATPTYVTIDVAEAVKAAAGTGVSPATASSLSVVLETSDIDSGSTATTYLLATLSDGHSLVFRVDAGAAECSEAVKAVVYTAKHASFSAATVEGSSYLFMLDDDTHVSVYNGKQEPEVQLTLLPTQAAGLTKQHGHIWRMFASPIVRAESKSDSAWKYGLRVLVVYSDGYTISTSTASGLLWERDEGAACAAAGMLVDVRPAHRRGTSTADFKADASEGDDTLALGSRLQAQAEVLQALSQTLVTGVQHLAKSLAADPSSTLRSLLGLNPQSGRVPGALAPSVDTGLQHVVLSRTRIDGAHHVCRPRWRKQRPVAEVVGSLTAKVAETGALLWSLTLPAQPGSREHAARSNANEWKELAVATRLRPIRGHEAEVLLVESGPLHGQKGKYGVWLTLVDATTGAILQAASYTASSPLERVVRTPVVHTGSQRLTYMTLHGGAQPEGVLIPSYADVASTLSGLGSDFIVAAPTYDADTDVEGVAGYTLASSSAKSTITLQGSSTGLPLSALSLTSVWSHALAHGAQGEVLLGLHFSTGDQAVLSSATQGADQMLQKAVSEESEGVASLEAALASGAGPHAPISPVTGLGDDSLLLKYSLGTSLVVAVGRPSSAQALHTAFERARQEVRRFARTSANLPVAAAGRVAGATCNLTVHLLSAVSGRVIRVQRTEGGQGPVGIAVADNWASYTYWNGLKGRPEIATLSAYEGALDRNALTPWSGSPVAQAARNAPAVVSAHSAPMPAVVHKTFALPLSLKPGLLSVTRTHLGISAHFLLLGTAAEGVYWMDRKLVDPRRPMPEAMKDADKAEGLLPYSPVLPFRHQWLLSHGDQVSRLHTLVSAPSGLESTSLVLGLGVDTLLARAAPARAWDALDREFNASLFLALLAILGLVTWVLGKQVKRKQLNDAWK